MPSAKNVHSTLSVKIEQIHLLMNVLQVVTNQNHSVTLNGYRKPTIQAFLRRTAEVLLRMNGQAILLEMLSLSCIGLCNGSLN